MSVTDFLREVREGLVGKSEEKVKLPPVVAGFDKFKAEQQKKQEADLIYQIVKKRRESETIHLE